MNLMYDRHKKSEKMSYSHVMPQDGNTWKVCSATDPSKFYIVMSSEINCKCKLQCRLCNVCPRMYDCNCKDGTFSVTVCKHAHLVHRFCKPGNVPVVDNSEETSGSELFSYVIEEESIGSNLTEDLDMLSDKLRFILPHVTAPENQIIVRDKMKELLQLVQDLSDKNSCNEFIQTTHGPSSKNLEAQLTFDRAPEFVNEVWVKSSDHQCYSIGENYGNFLINKFCDKCLKQKHINSTCIQWVQCDNNACNKWYYADCVMLM